MTQSIIHFFHVFSAVVWLGGLFFTGCILGPALRKNFPPEVRLPIVKIVAARFHFWGWGALGVLLFTGLFKLFRLISTPSIFQTSFGMILGIKLGLVMVMLLLTVLHDLVWGPDLIRLAKDPSSLPYRQSARRLAFWARINMGIGLLVLVCATLLVKSPFWVLP